MISGSGNILWDFWFLCWEIPKDDLRGRCLSTEDVRRLLAGPDRSRVDGARDHALMLLMLRTSLRVSEACGLRQSGVSCGDGNDSLINPPFHEVNVNRFPDTQRASSRGKVDGNQDVSRSPEAMNAPPVAGPI